MSQFRKKNPSRTNPSLPASLRTSPWSHIKRNASIKEGLKKPKQTCSIEEGVKGAFSCSQKAILPAFNYETSSTYFFLGQLLTPKIKAIEVVYRGKECFCRSRNPTNQLYGRGWLSTVEINWLSVGMREFCHPCLNISFTCPRTNKQIIIKVLQYLKLTIIGLKKAIKRL